MDQERRCRIFDALSEWILKAKSRKYQGVFKAKSRVETWQVRGIWSQQLEHKQVPKRGTEPGRSMKCYNAESDDHNILSIPDTSQFSVTLMLSKSISVSTRMRRSSCRQKHLTTIAMYLYARNTTSISSRGSFWEPYIQSDRFFCNRRVGQPEVGSRFLKDEELDLQYIYWIPKMQKIPIMTDS